MIWWLFRRKRQKYSGTSGLCVGDLTMTGEQLKPMGKNGAGNTDDIYKEQFFVWWMPGRIFWWWETMMSLAGQSADRGERNSCDLPVIATLTFEADGTFVRYGHKTAAIVLESLGPVLSVKTVPQVRPPDGEHYFGDGIPYQNSCNCKTQCRTSFSG